MCLLDFGEKGEDDFNNLKWESDLIKMIDFECEEGDYEIFEFKKIFTTKRVPKKKRLEFRVITECLGEERGFNDWQDFKKEQEARDFFESQKAHLEFLHEKENKENKVFDGRRYLWKLDNSGELTGEKGWF